jgi:hypothetical protein
MQRTSLSGPSRISADEAIALLREYHAEWQSNNGETATNP